ncbi:aspartyl/asparaginyl beta-hydroxylase domain-containing protein [Parasphingorhabdus sp.]
MKQIQAQLPEPALKRIKPSSLVVKFGKKIRRHVDRVLAKNSKVGNLPVFESSAFSFTKLLEDNADIIAQEARAVLAQHDGVHPIHEVSPDHSRIAHDKKWKSLFLIGYGYRFNHNCARCPETTKILEKIPGLNSGFFSIMEAGADIPSHCGVTKALLTCHLGLVIPDNFYSCGIKICDKVCHWQQGKTLVFDDTFRHEAWNRASGDRVVLLLQFDRPMTLLGRLVGGLFLSGIRGSSFVQDGRRNVVERDKALGLKASSSPFYPL